MKFFICSTKSGICANALYDAYPWLLMCDYVTQEKVKSIGGRRYNALILKGNESEIMLSLKDLATTLQKELILDFGCDNLIGSPMVEIHDDFRS